MGNKSSDYQKDSKPITKAALRPRDLKFLCHQTGLSQEQIILIFEKIFNENLTGNLDLKEFVSLYSELRTEPKEQVEEIAKYEEKRIERQKQALDSGEELGEEEEFNVDAMLQEEFADELQEPEAEEEVSEEEVKENMLNDIKTTFENQSNLIESVKVRLNFFFFTFMK